MIIWTGFGILAPVIIFLGMVATSFTVGAIFGPGYVKANNWALGAGLAVGGALCWWIGTLLYKRGARVLVDRATGREVHDRPSHTLFFIPMHWLGVLAILGAIPLGIYGLPEDLRKSREERLAEEMAKADPALSEPSEPAPAKPKPSIASTQGSNFASPEAAQAAAVKRYPDLAVAGSKFNAAFVELHKQAKAQRSELLKDNDWPMVLADEVAKNLK